MTPHLFRRVLAVGVVLALLLFKSTGVRGQCGQSTITSRQGNNFSRGLSLSADGRYMAFYSSATDLVPGDTNAALDVFVYDRVSCTTERVSVDSSETPGNGSSFSPSISDDGRYVAFYSTASNLVAADTNGWSDVFVRDRTLGTTARVSVDSSGAQTVAGPSIFPEISGNGLFVAFVSNATNLVPVDTNGEPDAFVRDLVNGTTERVSIATGGAQGESPSGFGVTGTPPAISNDGRYVAFGSNMDNLVGGDSNGATDVFRRDRQTGTTICVSLTSSGSPASGHSPAISGDGGLIAFTSGSADLVADDTNGVGDVFVRDTILGTTERVSMVNQGGQADAGSSAVDVSGDGRYVAFQSFATNLVVGDTNGLPDVFVRDRILQATRRVSTTVDGVEVPFPSSQTAMSANGLFVGFESGATNLVSGDTNGTDDVFSVNWAYVSVPPNVELIRNASFASGTAFWLTFATPDPSYIVWDTTGDVFRFYRQPPPPGTTNQAVAFQNTTAQLLPFAPLAAQFDLANSSSVRKRISVLIHDADFSDLHVCTFWLEPMATMQTYQMRTHTTEAWGNATLSFYAATPGSDGGYYEVDNVSLQYAPAQPADETSCIDPTAPAPPGGAPGAELIANGSFTTGLLSWALFGQITTFVSGGVLNFVRPAGTPAGAVLQLTNQALATDQIVTATFQFGNSSTVRKRVTVLLHEFDFSDLSACTFWLPPGQPLLNYVMRAHTTKAWTNAMLSVYPATIGLDEWTRLDNASFRTTPASSTFGTDCVEPSTSFQAEAQSSSSHRAASGLGTRPRARGSMGVAPVASGAPPVRVWLAPHDLDGEVQISTDGILWLTIAVVPASGGWSLVDVDLSDFVGQSVRLRFVEASF